MSVPKKSRRAIPAVDRVLKLPEAAELVARHGRPVVVGWVREVLRALRGAADDLPEGDSAMSVEIARRLVEMAEQDAAPALRKVINGTGIVIHTNLGRAPLAAAAVERMAAVATGANLEIDLVSGQRGRRGAAAEALCAELTGAEEALVVNNCAAATLLALQTLAAGREVVISRGQLVEIGGAFRLPEVFAQAGVTLREVGTTNRTRLADYEKAIGASTAALLRVHPSNFRITGFHEDVSIAELAELAHAHGLPAIDDVGSGCLYDLARYGLPQEPIVRDSLRAGADLAFFSGDKLLGGPQCGIVVGRKSLVERLRRNALARALRVDRLTLAALEATLEIHRAGRAFDEIPALRQLALSADELRVRGARLVEQLGSVAGAAEFSLKEVEAAPGGGAYPGATIPSVAICATSEDVEGIARRLRLGEPAVLARLSEGCLLIDLRTVLPEDDERLVERIVESVTV